LLRGANLCARKAPKVFAMKKSSFSALLLVSLSLCLLSCGGGASGDGNNSGGTPCNAQPGTTCESLTFNGTTRTYLLHVPSNFQQNTGALVIFLHGSGSTALGMEPVTGLSALADEAGFAVAYPDGLHNPATGETDWAYFFNDFTDDVGFFRQFIHTLQTRVRPDSRRIYVTGHSAGGFMSHRLGVQLSDLIAAIGVVEGGISSNGDPSSVPSTLGPVSVLILHGDQDHTVLYCGSTVDASQEESFNYWSGASGDRCSSVDTPLPLCDNQGNITAVIEKDASHCGGNTEVKLYKLVGGTHAWNTREMNDPGQVPYNPNFNADTGIRTSDILWNFFASHPKP
jgi:polyhydroxybutyrate depolymerase